MKTWDEKLSMKGLGRTYDVTNRSLTAWFADMRCLAYVCSGLMESALAERLERNNAMQVFRI